MEYNQLQMLYNRYCGCQQYLTVSYDDQHPNTSVPVSLSHYALDRGLIYAVPRDLRSRDRGCCWHALCGVLL